jgi:hypothetical protein
VRARGEGPDLPHSPPGLVGLSPPHAMPVRPRPLPLRCARPGLGPPLGYLAYRALGAIHMRMGLGFGSPPRSIFTTAAALASAYYAVALGEGPGDDITSASVGDDRASVAETVDTMSRPGFQSLGARTSLDRWSLSNVLTRGLTVWHGTGTDGLSACESPAASSVHAARAKFSSTTPGADTGASE